jgi:hypothetical protein
MIGFRNGLGPRAVEASRLLDQPRANDVTQADETVRRQTLIVPRREERGVKQVVGLVIVHAPQLRRERTLFGLHGIHLKRLDELALIAQALGADGGLSRGGQRGKED